MSPILAEIKKRESKLEQLTEYETTEKDPTRYNRRDSFKVLKFEEKMRKLKESRPKLAKKVMLGGTT